MTKRASTSQEFAASGKPHANLRAFWRSSKANKKRVEHWVDTKTNFGSVPVFLRSGGDSEFEKVIKDLNI